MFIFVLMIQRTPHTNRTTTLLPYPTLGRSQLPEDWRFHDPGGGHCRRGEEDLPLRAARFDRGLQGCLGHDPEGPARLPPQALQFRQTVSAPARARTPQIGRSEEHTSELQSLMRISYAVFCLKKKTKHLLNKLQKSRNIFNNTKWNKQQTS